VDRDPRAFGECVGEGGCAPAAVEGREGDLDVTDIGVAQRGKRFVRFADANAEVVERAVIAQELDRVPDDAGVRFQVASIVEQQRVEAVGAQPCAGAVDAVDQRAADGTGVAVVDGGDLGRDAHALHPGQSGGDLRLGAGFGRGRVDPAHAYGERAADQLRRLFRREGVKGCGAQNEFSG
jgi:hypothetical protein